MGVTNISFILLLVAWSVQGGHDAETRVVGGKDAPEGLAPHQVALKTKKNQTFCGGAVISDRWILTAAHCVNHANPARFVAVVGTLSRTQGGTSYDISKIISHQDFNKTNQLENDIAVLSTIEPIQFSKNVQPLALPEKDVSGGMTCLLTGWGRLGKNKDLPDKLQYLYVKTISSTECNRYYSRRTRYRITSNQTCTLNKRGEGGCQGDSGGSLVCDGSSAGIVSFNSPCANNFPDAFTNTYMYKSWIAENTKSP